MAITLAQAAEATGLNRSTILRAVKAGRISGTRDDLGTWFVEPAEVFRIFPPAEAKPSAAPQPADGELRLRAELAEARLADLKVLLEDMRSERDKWQEQAARLALAKPERRRWWRLVG